MFDTYNMVVNVIQDDNQKHLSTQCNNHVWIHVVINHKIVYLNQPYVQR